MRFKYLIPMVLGAMLIMTTAPAYASLNSIGTQVNNGFSVQLNSGSSSTTDVSQGNTLSWGNTLYNNDATDSTVYCGIDGSDLSSGITSTYHKSQGQITYLATAKSVTTSVNVLASPSGNIPFVQSHKYSANSNPFINSYSASVYNYIY